jgi:hypothetical protein
VAGFIAVLPVFALIELSAGLGYTTAKTHLQHILIAVAINDVLVISYLTELRISKPYVAPFAALAAPA